MNTIKSISTYCKNQFSSILLIIFFITEAYSKYILVNEHITSSIPKNLKGSIFIFFLAYLLFKNKKQVLFLAILSLSFFIGQYYLPLGFSKDSILTFSKYLFPLVLLSFFAIQNNQNKQEIGILNVFEGLIILNSILIIIGFFFKMPLLETYTYGARFGYNGLFINSTTGSYVSLIALTHFLIRYKATLLKQKHFLLFLVSLLFMGTKVVYLSIVVTFLFYFYFYSNLKFKRLILLVTILMGSLALFLAFFKFGIFNEIRQEKGLFSAIFSFRNDLLIKETLPYIEENWGIINYFFGGIADFKLRSEFGFIDLFVFFGGIGALLYLYLFFKSFFIFEINKKNVLIITYFVFIIFFAGNFFTYATLPIYILVLRESFHSYPDLYKKE